MNQRVTTPAVDVLYTYTGREVNSTGLYYYKTRHYDPTFGRFILPDALTRSSESVSAQLLQ